MLSDILSVSINTSLLFTFFKISCGLLTWQDGMGGGIIVDVVVVSLRNTLQQWRKRILVKTNRTLHGMVCCLAELELSLLQT